tara:strand:- start:10027 stop:10878 length:852 start_codon:yes stop_codon:yes gene_type:complete
MAEEIGSAPGAGNPVEASPAPAEAISATPTSPLDGFQDADLRAYAEGKGFDKAGFEGVVKSYSHLEKMTTNRDSTVVIPGLDATPEQQAEFYNRLGRPEAEDGYSFKLDKGIDTSRLDAMRGKAHALGITDAQFSGLAQADMDFMNSAVQDQADNAVISKAEAELALKKEWGAAYDTKVAGIDVAAHKLGFSNEQLVALHKTMGPVDAMKFVDGLNSKIGDHKMEKGELVGSGHKTPEQAKLDMDALMGKKEFVDAWTDKSNPGHKSAVAQKAALARLMSGVV